MLSRISKGVFRVGSGQVKDAEDGICHRTWDLLSRKPVSSLTGILCATRLEANWTAATLPLPSQTLETV